MKRSISVFCAAALFSGAITALPAAADTDNLQLLTELTVLDTEHSQSWSLQQALQPGALIYGDRDAAFTQLPNVLLGAEWIQTACDSKSAEGDLAICTARADLTLYIAMDLRVSVIPDWLNGWAFTNGTAYSSKDVTYAIYGKEFRQGEQITLGTNGQSAGCVNYAVFATEQDTLSLICPEGDADNNGTVDSDDAKLMQQYLLGLQTDIPYPAAADLNHDGLITAADLTALKQKVVVEVIPASKYHFAAAEGLFDASNTDTLGLSYPEGLETVTVWRAEDSSDHYCNGVCLAAYRGQLFCQWQSSAVDEDSADTHVMYAVSSDQGRTWSEPQILAENIGNGYCTSGGWYATDQQLVAYVNFWESGLNPTGGWTYYITSQDGKTWSTPQQVTMADGSPLAGVFEQDPHVLSSGRIINAAHFQPGLFVCPIYTDDPTGISGWKKGSFTPNGIGNSSTEMEPSSFVQADGTLAMIFRDQNSSFTKRIAFSEDDGETWSEVQMTNMPDARTKQSAGNLSDGTAFLAGCPIQQTLRSPLAVTLSADGQYFDRAFLLRANSEDPELRYEGKAKRQGFHYCKSLVADGYLYVGYATNKEAVEISIIPESSLR